jgi:hypothetical protein
MTLFRSSKTRDPVVVETVVPPAEHAITIDAVRIATAVARIDQALDHDRERAGALYDALLEARHILAPMQRLDPPPYAPGRS